MFDDFFWSTSTLAVRFGKSEQDAFALPKHIVYDALERHEDGVYTIFDTGATSIYISSLWYDSFMEELARVSNARFESYNERMYARCSHDFPSVYF